MEPSAIPTQFAPAERLSPEEIQAQSAFFSNLPYLRQLADGLPTVFLALNKHRQFVFGNQALADLAGRKRLGGLFHRRNRDPRGQAERRQG